MRASTSNFWNSSLARLLMVVLAIGLAVLAWFQLETINALKTERSDISTPATLASLGGTEALAQCVELRNAAIEQSEADGFIEASAVEAEKAAALSVCISQVRGSY